MSALPPSVANLEARVAAIEARNTRVERDKRWEVSLTRRTLVALLTYVFVLSFLLIIEADRPFLGACVPLAGYTISTFALRPIRKFWDRKASDS